MSRSSRFTSGAIALALAFAPLASGADSYQRSEHAYRVPAVALTDQSGRAVPLDALLGGRDPVVLQFIFTSCPAVCPILSATVATAQKHLGAGVRIVSISIDPEHDTPARLTEYAARFHTDRRWTFLTGDRARIVAVQRAFDADSAAIMNHRPLTFLRRGAGDLWIRLEGLTGAADLAAEFQRASR